MKLFTWLILVGLLIVSVFNIWDAELNSNILGVALMLLLISLFSDLREFNFWGLSGRKTEKDFRELEGKPATAQEKVKVDQKELEEAQRMNMIQLMDTAQGNFLALAFEIERLLRMYATIFLIKDVPSNINPSKLTKELHKKGLLTDVGVKQVESIRWLRNMLIHGRQNEINQATLNAGIELAHNLYQELYNRLYQR